jgi:hypothetical protein
LDLALQPGLYQSEHFVIVLLHEHQIPVAGDAGVAGSACSLYGDAIGRGESGGGLTSPRACLASRSPA